MLNKNLVKFIFSLVLTLSLFYFLLKSTESGLTFNFFKNFINENFLIIFFSYLLLILGLTLNFFTWQYITKKNEIFIKHKSAFKIFCTSELAKYIPGKIFSLVSKAWLYKEKNFSLSKISQSIIEEHASSSYSNLFYIIIYFIFFNIVFKNFFLSICIFLIYIIFPYLCINYFNKFRIFFSKFFSILKNIFSFKFSTIYTAVTFYILINLVFGFSFCVFLIGSNLDTLSFINIVKIICSQSLGNLASVVLFFFPGGIGVKEVSSVLILKDSGFENLISLLIIYRILFIFAEISVWIFSVLLNVNLKKKI